MDRVGNLHFFYTFIYYSPLRKTHDKNLGSFDRQSVSMDHHGDFRFNSYQLFCFYRQIGSNTCQLYHTGIVFLTLPQ